MAGGGLTRQVVGSEGTWGATLRRGCKGDRFRAIATGSRSDSDSKEAGRAKGSK